MSAIITSIHNCPVKSISFQNIEKCKINKNIGIEGDRVFAFSQNLDLDQSKEFEKNPDTRKGKWNKIVTLKNTPVFNKYNFINVIVFNVYVKYVLQSYLNSVVKGLKYYLESKKTVLHNQFGKHIWYS